MIIFGAVAAALRKRHEHADRTQENSTTGFAHHSTTSMVLAELRDLLIDVVRGILRILRRLIRGVVGRVGQHAR